MHGDRGAAGGCTADTLMAAGPLVRVHFSFSRGPWRVGPAWAVLAGALVSGWAPVDAVAILRLGAAIVLGDLAWGSLRPRPTGDLGQTLAQADSVRALPYATPAAPLARLLHSLSTSTGAPVAAAWQSFAVGLALTLVLSLLIGPAALVLSASALLLITWTWLWQVNRGGYSALGLALLDVAWPWLLGMSLVGQAALVAHGLVGPLTLLGAFGLLQWGILRAGQGNIVATTGVWVGQIAVLAALVVLKQAWASTLVAAVLAAPSWWLLRRERAGIERALPWWWAALAVSALSLT